MERRSPITQSNATEAQHVRDFPDRVSLSGTREDGAAPKSGAGFSFPGKLEAWLSLPGPQLLWLRNWEHGAYLHMRYHCAHKISQNKENMAPSVLCQECFLSWDQMSFLGKNDLTTAPGTLCLLLVFWQKALDEATKGGPRSASTAGRVGMTWNETIAPSHLSQAPGGMGGPS